MKMERLAKNWSSILAVMAFTAGAPSFALAQDAHSHSGPGQELLQDQKSKGGALVRAVREATERFKDVAAAEAEGYHLLFGCVSGPDAGAMGMHFVNGALVGDGVIDAAKPEIILYEPQPNGSLKLTGADFLVLADQWNATHSSAPELMGQIFHFFDAPNRFGLPPFYTLHVWAWKDSPTGTFVNWNTSVSCNAFSGQ
jgi:hypothetical protein